MSTEREHVMALLATVRGVMTGGEIDTCELLVTESEEWGEEEWEAFEDEHRDTLTVLETQFAAEIGKAMAGKAVQS